MSKRTEYQLTLVLIRHGETASNKEHRYLGRTEEPLSEEGKEKLVNEKKLGKYPEVDVLFTSPMRRCLETAAIIYPSLEAVGIPEWREMDFGDFEGKNHLDLKDDSRYQAWIDSNGTLTFPNGESREDFIHRASLGMNEMLLLLQRLKKDKEKTPHTIGMIVHGGTIMALLSRFRGGEYFDYQVSNGAGYKCRLFVTEDKLQIVDLEKI